MHDFDEFERRLAAAIRSDADASVGPFTPESIVRAAIADTGPGATRVRRSSRPTSRFGRGRGMPLLAAAALLLVGGALAAGSGLLRLPTVVAPVPEPSVVAIATASPDATSPTPSGSAAPSASPIPVAGPGGAWIQTGSMTTPLGGPAVRLLDGRVLVVGGDPGNDVTSAEVYDPATGTWSATGKMVQSADADDATSLGDGTVLVTGPNSAQLYDPASGTWTATGKMIGNGGYSFTVLRDGRVLAVGGDSPQLYDPASGTWTATGKMITASLHPAATLLSDGRVLVAGGSVPPDDWTHAAEVYDPVTGSWTEIADTQEGVAPDPLGIATQLPDGKVLVYSRMGSEVYDPTTGTWTARTMPTKFLPDPMALLSDGTVLTDAIDDQPGANDPAACPGAVFDPRTGSLTTTPSMLQCDDARSRSFTLLLDGTVLAAGGSACDQGGVTPGSGGSTCVSTGAAELYVPAGMSLPQFSFPSPSPPVFPSPTPVPPLLPSAVGPTPPNARSWTVTVENESSEPATMFVAEGEEGVLRLVGSATPNVVPAGTTMKVTFLFPAKGPDDGWITVNPRLGEGADVGSVGADNIGMPGKIWITAECGGCWVGPAQ